MRLGALLVLLYAYACAADDVEVYDEEPAADEEEPEVIDESIRRSVDALLRFPLQLDEIKHRITVSDGDKDTGFLELSGREEVADAWVAMVKGLQVPLDHPIEAFMLPDDSDRIRRFRDVLRSPIAQVQPATSHPHHHSTSSPDFAWTRCAADCKGSGGRGLLHDNARRRHALQPGLPQLRAPADKDGQEQRVGQGREQEGRKHGGRCPAAH